MHCDDKLGMTSAQVARLCGVTVMTVTNWRKAGTGPSFRKVKGQFYYDEMEVLEFEVERQRTAAEAEERARLAKANAKEKVRSPKRPAAVFDPTLKRVLVRLVMPDLVRGRLTLPDVRDAARAIGLDGALHNLTAEGCLKIADRIEALADEREDAAGSAAP